MYLYLKTSSKLRGVEPASDTKVRTLCHKWFQYYLAIKRYITLKLKYKKKHTEITFGYYTKMIMMKTNKRFLPFKGTIIKTLPDEFLTNVYKNM